MRLATPTLATTATIALLAAAHTLDVAHAQTCPPPNFATKANLNPSVYFDATGCTLQMVTVGNPAPVFCDFGVLSHTVNAADKTVSPRVVIGSNAGNATGPRTTLALNGKIPDKTKPAQALLSLGTANIPYWIIEAGSFKDLLAAKTSALATTQFTGETYDWVITATGDPPTTKTAGGCLPPTGMALRIVSKQTSVTPAVEAKLVALAKAKGYDVSGLAKVTQKGCVYK